MTAELQHLLDLTIAQLDHASAEGKASVSALVELFTAMHGELQAIAHSAGSGEPPERIAGHAARLEDIARHAVVHLQFYDLLSQRLGHAVETLRACRTVLDNPGQAGGTGEWAQFWSAIGSLYTMTEDRRLLESVLDGATPEQALARLELERAGTGDGDADVELF